MDLKVQLAFHHLVCIERLSFRLRREAEVVLDREINVVPCEDFPPKPLTFDPM